MASIQVQLAKVSISGPAPAPVIPAEPKRSWVIKNIGTVTVNVFPYWGGVPNTAPAVMIPVAPNDNTNDSDSSVDLTDGWAAVGDGGLVLGIWR
jgi:hypothetical protein